MATINIGCRISYDSESNRRIISTTPSTSEGTPLIVQKGDTVRFTFLEQLEANGYSFNIGNWDESYWSGSNSFFDQSSGGEISRLTNVDAYVGSGYTDTLTFYANHGIGSYARQLSIFVQIIDNVDGVPDQFNVGGPITGIAPSSELWGDVFVVRGMTISAWATCSDGASFTINSGAPVTSGHVSSGDAVQLRMTSSPAWNTTNYSSLTIGGVTSTLQVTTIPEPALDQLIYFPKTVQPVSLNEVIAFFGGTYMPAPSPRNMLTYLKGGLYVPNIAANWKIPTSAPLKVSDFLGSATALLFTRYPKSQNVSGSTLAGVTTLQLIWAAGAPWPTGFDVGYGPGMKGAVEYRYSITEKTGELLSQGVILQSNTGSPGSWSNANTYITLSQSHNNWEARYQGTLLIEMRSIYNPAVLVSATVNYTLNFYGP